MIKIQEKPPFETLHEWIGGEAHVKAHGAPSENPVSFNRSMHEFLLHPEQSLPGPQRNFFVWKIPLLDPRAQRQ